MKSQNRIKKNIEFKRLYNRSKRFYNRDFRLMVSNNNYGHPRFGFTITRKFGKANKRNKIRRRLKEIIRLNLDIFEDKDYIIAPKNHTLEFEYKDLEKTLLHVVKLSKEKKWIRSWYSLLNYIESTFLLYLEKVNADLHQPVLNME